MKKLMLVLLLVASAAQARSITEKDIFRFQWVGDPQVSPDGSQVAFVRVTVDEKKDTYLTSIWAVATRPGATPRRVTNGPRDSAPRWSHDGKLLAFLRSGEKDGRPAPAQIHVLRLDGGEPRAITSLSRAVESIAWSPVAQTIAFTASTKAEDLAEKKEKKDEERESDIRVINQAVYRANGAGYRDPLRAAHIWTIDVTDDGEAKPKQLTVGDFSEEDVNWSPDGARIFYTSNRTYEPYYDVRSNVLYSIAAKGGEPAKIASYDGAFNAFAVSPDGRWVAFVGSLAHPVQSHTQNDLFVVSTTPGSQPRNLTKSFDGDVLSGLTGDQAPPRGNRGARPEWSADGKTIYVSAAEEGMLNLKRVDVASGRVEPWTSGKHALMTYSIEGGTAVALVSTPTMIGDLFAVGADGALARLTNVNEKLWSELTLTEPDVMWTTSFDGKRVQSWIQKPPDFDPSKKYPMILNIHGGPHAAYGYIFDHEFQWMAAKGYVVLYPNPRGSTTYGEQFANIIQYRYPGDDHKDLMAATDDLIKRGYIDTKKLGITGGSGGGVLTNWAIGHTDRFAAAVSQRSIADWTNWWYTGDFTLFQPAWFRKAPWEDPEDFKARSPITYIDKVKTPLMLIEGEVDYRTPATAGGELMFRALKYRRVPTVMVRFPDESHELSRSGKPWHRVERLQHIVGWFDKWLMGVAKPEYERGLRAEVAR
jgi:dipeptidyl aminopeptidase/acylaminoacyl peptidase